MITWSARGEIVYEGEMMDWKKVDEDDYEFHPGVGILLSVYRSRVSKPWKWEFAYMGQRVSGRADTEAEAEAAAIAKARELLAANRDELDKALAVLNAGATLEPTP